MNKTLHVARYLFSDVITSGIAWTFFYAFRKLRIESYIYGHSLPIDYGPKFYSGLVLIPLFWVLLYHMTGYYKDIYRKSRLQELWQTIYTSCFGVVILFFAVLLDDHIYSYKNYYQSFTALLSFHFVLTYFPRVIITSITISKIRRRRIGFNTVLVGNNGKALNIYKELSNKPKSTGNKFIGFVNVRKKVDEKLKEILPCLGSVDGLSSLINAKDIEEVIIAIESSEHEDVWKIINKLQGTKARISIIPNMYDILTGSVKMSTIYGTPLIQIKHDLMPAWQENVKRIFDILVSIFALLLLSPMYAFLAIGVKMSSKGSVFYSHERIGRYGKPFTIYKYRSMYIGAEKNGPALSSSSDSRITPFGLFMRKSRLDEIPQFYNVLIGDMSLVGPRPERLFFIEKIVERAPHYNHVHKVRPGITSWGQVKFGYAENVDEMIERLKYDLIYLENMSLYADFKILIYTIKTVLKASGK